MRIIPQLFDSGGFYSYYGGIVLGKAEHRELHAAGLLESRSAANGFSPLLIPDAAKNFARKLKFLASLKALRHRSDFLQRGYLARSNMPRQQIQHLRRMAKKLPLPWQSFEYMFEHLTPNPRWQELALADMRHHPVAARLIALFRERAEPIPLAEVPAHLPDLPTADVHAVLTNLLFRLALFEDLDEESKRIIVGMPEVVRQNWRRWQARPTGRPPLTPVPKPPQLGPANGFMVADLRAVLIEMLRLPARIKNNGEIFQKDVPRFEATLTPLPDWLESQLNTGSADRFTTAHQTAFELEFAQACFMQERSEMRVTKQGQEWLAQPAEAQYAAIAKRYRQEIELDGYLGQSADCLFLGSYVVAFPLDKARSRASNWNRRADEVKPLRDSIAKCFDLLEVNKFYSLADFTAHACYDKNNPLRLGLADGQVDVTVGDRPVSTFPEELDRLAEEIVAKLILQRLIPFGGVQAGWDGSRLLIAKQPLCDAYFGRPSQAGVITLAQAEVGKVIIQPDFTILVIGENPKSAADLAPFCERGLGPASHGALQFLLTKSSVVRAAAAGLSGPEILARLERHSSVPIPMNVRHEIGDWAGSICHVQVENCILIRCPDAAAADRAAGLAGKQSQRLGNSSVAIPPNAWTPSLRKKLRDAGFILPPEAERKRTRRQY